MAQPSTPRVSVCPLQITRSSSPEISTSLFFSRVWPPQQAFTNVMVYLACFGVHTSEGTEFVFSPLWLLSPNITRAFFSCLLEAGACVCVDQVVRSWIRVIGIAWKNVYKLLSQWPARGGDLIQFHSFPSLYDMGPTAFWSRILSAPILRSSHLLPILLPPLLPPPWNWILSPWPPGTELSQHFTLCGSHSSHPVRVPSGFLPGTGQSRPRQNPPPCLPLLILH